MPFLDEPFEHDIFVSYSHGDVDGHGESPLKTWSRELASKLESRIRMTPHFESLAVFLDQDHRPDQGVDPTVPLPAQLEASIGASALLLMLMTPRYLLSDWCARERDWWIDQQAAGQLPTEGRLVVCRTLPHVKDEPWRADQDHRDWPEAVRELEGFWFHDRKDVDFSTVPFCWDGTTSDINEYNEQLREVVRFVTRRLREVKQRQQELAKLKARRARLADASPVVYLHARETQRDAWEETQDALRSYGHKVVPSQPEAAPDGVVLDAKALKQRRNERIRKISNCDALLMVGEEQNDELETDILEIGHRDRQYACDLVERPLPCALLNRTGAHNETAEQFRIEQLDGRPAEWPRDFATWLRSAADGG